MRSWILFSTVWAIVLLGAWCVWEDRLSKQGEEVEIAIRGYDPRDLLAGHFVTYQLDFGETSVCQVDQYNPSPRCVCLQVAPETKIAQAEYSDFCSNSRFESCKLWIKGQCDYSGRFEAGIERYYIPEEYAPFLATVPANSSVAVRINARGRASLQSLKVAGKDLAEFVAEQKKLPASR